MGRTYKLSIEMIIQLDERIEAKHHCRPAILKLFLEW